MTEEDTANRPFAGRAAVVTGGAGGIGRAIAEVLARRGAEVVIADIDPATPGVATEIGAGHVLGDLRETGVRELLWQRVRETGAAPHTLVNTAFTEVRGGFLDLPEDAWQSTYDVTFGVAARLSVQFGRILAGAPGAIVNVASVHSFGASSGLAPYEAAKAAVLALTRSTALELGPFGVRCNAVAPAFVKVPRNRHRWQDERWVARLAESYPLRRVGEPEDIAKAVAFLASDDAGFVSGTCLVVDGGYTAQLPGEVVK
jgi:NAD(P)-dependent dehydrogenase (short-subunit alcohol dehydrogenase family)